MESEANLVHLGLDMTGSLFETMPEDVLRIIFAESSKNDLFSLSTVSNRFHVLLEPQIYHKIEWSWEKDSIPPISRLLRSILGRPELASHIQHMKLTAETFHLPPFRMKLPPAIPVPEVELKKIIATVEESKVPNAELWITMLRGGPDLVPIDVNPKGNRTVLVTMDALLAVLLSQLPNLVSLCLGPNFTKEATVLGSMFKHALYEPNVYGFSKFEKLEEVQFSPRIDIEKEWGRKGNDKRPNNSLCPLTFFYAPVIQHITATIEEPKVFEWPISPPALSTLTSLDITLLREDTLGHILSRCHKLQSLSYRWFGDADCRQPRPVLSCPNLNSSLLSVKGTLKTLMLSGYIAVWEWDCGQIPPTGMDSTLTVLPKFTQLEELEVPMIFLLGWDPEDKIKLGDVLPKTIRQLTLSDDFVAEGNTRWGGVADVWDSEWLDVIGEWLESWRESTSQLQRLCLIHNEVDQSNWLPHMIQRFMKLGENTGLEVEFILPNTGRSSQWPRVDS